MRLYPDFVDAVETRNASHSNPNCHKPQSVPQFDVDAAAYAEKHNLPQTAGSDNHDTNMLDGGIGVEKPFETVFDYMETVMKRRPYVLFDGSEKSYPQNF